MVGFKNFCLCGCGCLVKNKYKLGHNNLGKKYSEERKRKMSEGNKGKKRSKEHCEKMSIILRGLNLVSPNKGKKLSEEWCKKLSEAHKGQTSWMKGKHHKESTKKKLSDINKGKKLSEETKKKISETMKIQKQTNIIKVFGGRNYLNSKSFSHIVWNEHNPDNPWRKGYHVHHKDGNSLNDSIENLELLTVNKHEVLHKLGTKASEETKLKLSKIHKGNKHNLGKKLSEEHRKNMSLAQKKRWDKIKAKNV